MILVVTSPDSPAAAWVGILARGGFGAIRRDTLQAAVEILPVTRAAAVVIDWPSVDEDDGLLFAMMSGPHAPELCVLVAEEGKGVASANLARGELADVVILRKPVTGLELVKALKEGANNP